MLLDVLHVEPQKDFVLLLEFENGERRRFDMAPYIDQKPWDRLKANNTFSNACVGFGTVTWPNNIDIDPETLYELSTPLS
jgi:hypothetical protein